MVRVIIVALIGDLIILQPTKHLWTMQHSDFSLCMDLSINAFELSGTILVAVVVVVTVMAVVIAFPAAAPADDCFGALVISIVSSSSSLNPSSLSIFKSGGGPSSVCLAITDADIAFKFAAETTFVNVFALDSNELI